MTQAPTGASTGPEQRSLARQREAFAAGSCPRTQRTMCSLRSLRFKGNGLMYRDPGIRPAVQDEDGDPDSLPGLHRRRAGPRAPTREERTGHRKELAPSDHITGGFVLAAGADLVDFGGPSGVFEYVDLPGRQDSPFELHTVAESKAPLKASGGLTSGIDLALHVVDRYFGRKVAEATARSLEYPGRGWKDSGSSSAFAHRPLSTDKHPICPACEREVSRATAPRGAFRRRTIYFCSEVRACSMEFVRTSLN